MASHGSPAPAAAPMAAVTQTAFASMVSVNAMYHR
jgi:hypothetical protein